MYGVLINHKDNIEFLKNLDGTIQLFEKETEAIEYIGSKAKVKRLRLLGNCPVCGLRITNKDSVSKYFGTRRRITICNRPKCEEITTQGISEELNTYV